MIDKFIQEYRWLSNFWPVKVGAWGLVFDSMEAAYQAAKCANEEDRKRFVNIDARTAKALGKQIQMRPDFDEKKLMVMKFFLDQKFREGTALQKYLISTHPQDLVEGNTWGDTFWGVCNGVGENNLGKLLMEIRDSIVKNEEN